MSADPGELTRADAGTGFDYLPRHGRALDGAELAPLPLQRTESLLPDADGELAVLGDSWRILTQIPVADRGADIDQVAIGPGGVFAIHTTAVPPALAWIVAGEVKVSRMTHPHVRTAAGNAKRASKLLSGAAGFGVHVNGVLGVVDAEQTVTVRGRFGAGDVAVVPRARVAGFLHAQPTLLSGETMNRIWAVARHLSTWQPGNLRKDDFWSGR